MLKRVPSKNAAKQKRYRERQSQGIIILHIAVDWLVVDMLVKHGGISEADADSGDARRLSQAVTDWLNRSARSARR